MLYLCGVLAVWCMVASAQHPLLRNVPKLVFTREPSVPGQMHTMKQVGGPYVSVPYIECINNGWDSHRVQWGCRMPHAAGAALDEFEIICNDSNQIETLVRSCRIEFSTKPLHRADDHVVYTRLATAPANDGVVLRIDVFTFVLIVLVVVGVSLYAIFRAWRRVRLQQPSDESSAEDYFATSIDMSTAETHALVNDVGDYFEAADLETPEDALQQAALNYVPVPKNEDIKKK